MYDYLYEKVLDKEWRWLGAREVCVRVAIIILFWLTSVLASFLIVYVKLPIDVLLSALAIMGVCWAKNLTAYIENTKLGKFLALSNQSRTQQKFMKLIEQLVEALPQLIIAVIYCAKNWAYIWLTEIDGESLLPLPSSLISPIFSAGSLVMGIVNGVTASREMKSQRALLVAAEKGDKQEVQRLIKFLKKSGSNVDFQDHEGHSALIYASWNGHPACVKHLLDAGANTDLLTSSGMTALMLASYGGHQACVQLLLNAKANTDLWDSDGGTALISASMKGYPACVKLLLDAKANTDLKDSSGWTALISASSGGHSACVKLLLDAGANTDLQDSGGRTALMWASLKGHPACVKLLLDAGANKDLMDQNNKTALIHAWLYQEIQDLLSN